MAHTKGPWGLGTVAGRCRKDHGTGWHPGAPDCVYEPEVQENDRCVYSIPEKTEIVGYDDYGEILSEADARLIATAPDMLEALRGLVELWPICGYHLEAYCEATLVPAARAAIVKATGEKL